MIDLKWPLADPLKLVTSGYNTPFDPLQDKTQSILTEVVSHFDWPPTAKQGSLGPTLNDTTQVSAAFLGGLRTLTEVHSSECTALF